MKKKISVTILLALLSFTFLFSSCFGDYFSDSSQIEYVEPYLSTYSTDLVVGDILYLDWYYQYQDDDYAYLVSSTGAWDLFRFWSSDTSVISVGQHGKITAKAPGTATIYVNAKNSHSYYSGFSITYSVTEDIFLSRELAYMELEKSRLTLNIDRPSTGRAWASRSGARTWRSSSSRVGLTDTATPGWIWAARRCWAWPGASARGWTRSIPARAWACAR